MTNRRRMAASWLAAVGLLSIAALGPATGAAEVEERQYLLERVDDVAVVQLYVDGFEELPLDEKILIYHLAQAAIAGRDIFIDQKYEHSLAIRDLIEEVLTHDEGLDEEILAEVRRYAKLFWINNGPHNPITGRKNVLGCRFGDFAEAVREAEANGAALAKREGEKTRDLLRRLKPILCDPEVDAQVTNKTPGEGRDVLLVEDVIDSGRTLRYLMRNLSARDPASVETCALLSKPAADRLDLGTRYVGFRLPDVFVVGYGLDAGERFRELPYISALPR